MHRLYNLIEKRGAGLTLLRVGCVALTLPDLDNANVGTHNYAYFARCLFVGTAFFERKKIMKKSFDNVREKCPLVHCITNYVTVNDVANALLAVGGSPIMSDEIGETSQITTICGGLVLNIGTLNQRTIPAMLDAGMTASKLGHPVVLDPVGAGASQLRTQTALEIMKKVKPQVIRGNISEIKTISYGSGFTSGVDAAEQDAVTEDNLDNAVAFVKEFAAKTGAVIAVTGKIDLVSDSNKCYVIRNGAAQMSRITGTGCQLSAVCAAFAVANPDNMCTAVAAAVCAMGYAGQLGVLRMGENDGNCSLRGYIIDALYNMTGDTLIRGAKYEIR